MTLLQIVQLLLPTIAYIIIFLFQKHKIDALTAAINAQKEGIQGQKAAIEAQTGTIAALKSQADGQVAITARLETIVDKTERHATTVLTNHEKLVKLVEDRAEREKQELAEQAERDKQKSEALLEEARGQLAAREEAINRADVQPEVASLLTSLSQESFATKEILTSLKTDLSKLITYNQYTFINNRARFTDSPSDKSYPMNSKHRLHNSAYMEILYDIYDNLNTADVSGLDIGKQYIKAVLENERMFLGKGVPLVINHLIFKIVNAYKVKSGKDLNYTEAERYAGTLGLGPFIATA